MNIDSSTFHSSQKVETAHISINRWMDKHNMVYRYKEILFSHKTVMYWYMLQHGGTLKDYAKWKRPDMKGHKSYDSVYMKSPE